ncbi:MAG: RNA-guided endonuclease InsQ/TnpB family protein, partial [Promethearchaeota archaeon]
MKQTEQIQLKKKRELTTLCHFAKNLYNEANYLIRQRFFKERHWTRYTELNKVVKTAINYRALPIQSSQQVLRLLDKTWKSFFKAITDWKKHPDKYLGRPRLPKYKRKNGEFLVIFTNQQCRITDGFLKFPKRANLTPIKTRMENSFQQVRIVPRGENYIVEIIYEQDVINLELNKSRIIGIDLGLTNLVTVVNNIGLNPFIIKGGLVKSINQYYNKQIAKFKSIKDKQNYKFETKRLQRLTLKRNNRL